MLISGHSSYLIIFGVAFFLALVLTPVSIVLAKKIGVVDIPDDGRRMHTRTIACLGGMAICFASVITLAFYGYQYQNVPLILAGGMVMFILGVIDDKYQLPAYIKFIVQMAIAVFMYYMGLRISFIHNYFGGGILHLGEAGDFIITVLWIVGITNSINLIDGLDGLAAGTVFINSLCMAYIIAGNGQMVGRMAASMGFVAIAGACLGFLPYNFSPAKTFMGDGGALFLGFMIACLSILGRLKESTVITMIVPIFVLALPLFDTLFAILRRTFKGGNIMAADNRHLHHILMQSGYGHKRAVIMLYGISGIMGVAAILLSKELRMEALILFAVACLYIYVFLTDPSHKETDEIVVDTEQDTQEVPSDINDELVDNFTEGDSEEFEER